MCIIPSPSRKRGVPIEGVFHMEESIRKRISLSLTTQEYEVIQNRCEQTNLSIADYMRQAALTGEIINYTATSKIMRVIGYLNYCSETTETSSLRQELKEVADQLWQFLK